MAARTGALYRSMDGVEHWSRVPLPDGVNGPNGLAIETRAPAHFELWADRSTAAMTAGCDPGAPLGCRGCTAVLCPNALAR